MLPQTRPSPNYGVINHFVLMLCILLKTLKSIPGPCSSKHGPAHLTVLSIHFVLMQCRLSKTLKNMAGTCSPTSSSRLSSLQVVKEPFRLDIMQLFKNFRVQGWAVFPQTRPSSSHSVEESFRFDVIRGFSKTLKCIVEPCSPTSPITAQLMSRCLIIFSS